MKRLLFVALLLILNVTLRAQGFPLTQNLASDSTLVRVGTNSKGAIRGSLIPSTYTDTTQANAGRIDDYPFAVIATSGDGNTWVRNYLGTGWVLLTGGNFPTGQFYNLTGNYLPITPANLGVGFNDPFNQLNFKTNNTVQLTIPTSGIVRSAAAVNKYLMMDTITKEMYYGDASSSTPTWQQTLTAGSRLTSSNTVSSVSNNFVWDSLGNFEQYGYTSGRFKQQVYNPSSQSLGYTQLWGNGWDVSLDDPATGGQMDLSASPTAFNMTLTPAEGSLWMHNSRESGYLDQILYSEGTPSGALPAISSTIQNNIGYSANRTFFTTIENQISGRVYNRIYLDSTSNISIGTKRASALTYKGLSVDLDHQVKVDSMATGGVAADSIVVITSNGYLKKRNASAFGGTISPGEQGQIYQTSNGAAAWKYDTTTLVTFTAGARFVADTALFTDSTLYGSFYLDGNDTLVITGLKAVMNGGTSDTLGIQVTYNDTINITGTNMFTATLPINSTTVGTSPDADDWTGGAAPFKIPPGNWVWLKSPTVVAGRKPYHLSVSVIGYKKRVN